jgi:hypothetical protein
MRKKRIILSIAAATAVWSITGCDDRGPGQSADAGIPAPLRPPSSSTNDSPPSLVPSPAPRAAASAAVQANVAPVRPPSFLTVDGKQVAFPAGKLAVLKNKPGDFRVRLCTDDPATALDPGYAGNSFLLDMKLNVDSVDKLNTASWTGGPNDSDTEAGLFLGGYRNPYHPQNVTVTFTGDPDDLSIYILGTFSHADPHDPFGPPRSVKVEGNLHVPSPGK